MAKEKYYYDSNTLTYKKVLIKRAHKFKNILFIILGVILTAFIGYIGFDQIFESPKEKFLQRQMENSELHYDLLSKKMNHLESILDGLVDRDNNIYRVYFEANPIPLEQRKAGFGGVNRYKALEGFDNSEMIKHATKKADQLSKQLAIQSKSLDDIVKMAENKNEMLSSIPAIMPVKKGQLTRMASGYGMRMHPTLKIRKMHDGMDFSAKRGTPIYASGNGVIVRADRSSTYGNVVYIDHGYGYETRYAHMQTVKTRKGRKVKRGDLIGLVGNTGRSVAPHLHYEVIYNGKHVNPINFYFGNLSAEEFAKMQASSLEAGQSLER